MPGDEGERHINLHIAPEQMAGTYANFANVTHSDYEFTITFARVDHEVEDGEVPGVVVARMNLSPRFMRELMDAMSEDWSRWETQEGIKGLPEVPPRRRRPGAQP
jgi:hypothetical protein